MLLLSAVGAAGQSAFQNLGFENTTLTGFLVNPFGPSYTTNATVPGWAWGPHETFGFGDANTTVAFNNAALDSAAVTLHGTNSPFEPVLAGKYSILLQGGSPFILPASGGALIFQTGQIPVDAQSLIYLGNAALQVFFNGQRMSPVTLDSTPTYTRWGIDISPYAGLSGELRFAVRWLASSMLDGIQFSPSPVPEPSAVSLSILGLVLVAALNRRLTNQMKRTGAAAGSSSGWLQAGRH